MTPPTPAKKRIDIERVGQMDLTVLASDRGAVPMNIGAVLEFDEPPVPALATMRDLLEVRVPGVGRLRQKLYRPPLGCGRPVWVDDPNFRLDDHLSERAWPAPGGRRELLDIAADLVCRRLDADRPLWRAWLVTRPGSTSGSFGHGHASRSRRWTGWSGHAGCAGRRRHHGPRSRLSPATAQLASACRRCRPRTHWCGSRCASQRSAERSRDCGNLASLGKGRT